MHHNIQWLQQIWNFSLQHKCVSRFAPFFATDKDASQEDADVPPSISMDPPTSDDTTTSTDANMSANPDVAGFFLNSDTFY